MTDDTALAVSGEDPVREGGQGTVRSIALVSIGQLSATLLSFVAIVLVARLLSVAEFGLFSLFMATMNIGAELSGKSFDVGMVRYAAEHLVDARERAGRLIFEAFVLRLVLSLLIALAGYLLSPWIAADVLGRPELDLPLRMASIATVAISFWWFFQSVLQCNERFLRHALLNLTLGIMKVAVVAALIVFSVRSLDTLLIAYTAILTAAAVIAFWFSPLKGAPLQRSDSELFAGFLRFSKWIVLTNIAMILLNQQGLFWVGHYLGNAPLGLYSSAWNLALGMDILAFSIMTVMLPSVSRIKTVAQRKAFFRSSLGYSILGTLLLSPFIVYSNELISWVYTPAYAPAGQLIRVFFIGTVITLFVHPVSLLLMTIERPQSYCYSAFVVLILTVAANYLFIPMFGLTAAAIIVTASKVGYGLLLVCAMAFYGLIPSRFRRPPTHSTR